MKKAILIVDMPMMCCECKFFRFANNDDWESSETICTINGKHCENGIDYKPRVCPLRPSPEKANVPDVDESSKMISKEMGLTIAYLKGYNKCLDELLGEDNE